MRKFWFRSVPAWVGLCVALALGARADEVSTDVTREQLNRAVYHQLVMLPQLTVFDDLSFKVDDGTVTLTGDVRNAVLKDEALSVVKHIAGVKQVDNEIQILPASFNDDRIRRAMVRSIFHDEQLFRYSMGAVPSIHIIVKNGNVELRGLVANQSDKNVAGIRANSVPGVFSVQNELQVERN